MATLTAKQERFVQEYLVDVNATQAAIRAGYSKKTATEQASRLLTNVKVSEAIANGKKLLADQTGVTAKKVIAEMALIGFANMQDYMDFSDPAHPQVDLTRLTAKQASVIAEVTHERKGFEWRIKLKLHDKLNALVNFGKHLGLFKERHEHTGADGEPINHLNFVEVVFVEPTKRKDEL
jgi:phage terminase small subunit